MSNRGRRVVIVLGMHRSGTSVLARGLKVLGVELGDQLLPAQPANPRGYWEDRDIYALNERILAALSRTWLSPGTIDDSLLASNAIEPLKAEAHQLLESRFGDFGLCGFKDPRMCLLMPFWQSLFTQLGLEDSYIISLRNPLAVADSLRARDDIFPDHAHLLWLAHLYSAFNNTRNKRRVVVEYDHLMEEPHRQLCRIAGALELPAPLYSDAVFRKFTGEFLDQGLRHHEFSLQHSPSESRLTTIALAVYELLREIAFDRLDCDSDRLRNQLDYVKAVLDSMQPLDALVEQELAARKQLNQDKLALTEQIRVFEGELDQIRESFAWRLASKYRERLENARLRHARAVGWYEKLAVWVLSKATGKQATKH